MHETSYFIRSTQPHHQLRRLQLPSVSPGLQLTFQPTSHAALAPGHQTLSPIPPHLPTVQLSLDDRSSTSVIIQTMLIHYLIYQPRRQHQGLRSRTLPNDFTAANIFQMFRANTGPLPTSPPLLHSSLMANHTFISAPLIFAAASSPGFQAQQPILLTSSCRSLTVKCPFLHVTIP